MYNGINIGLYVDFILKSVGQKKKKMELVELSLDYSRLLTLLTSDKTTHRGNSPWTILSLHGNKDWCKTIDLRPNFEASLWKDKNI